MDDMLKRDLTRRSFLKRASALGFGAASIGTVEWLLMRLAFAALVLWTLNDWHPFAFAAQPSPVGLARWIDLTWLHHDGMFPWVFGISALLCALYVVGLGLPLGGLVVVNQTADARERSLGGAADAFQVVDHRRVELHLLGADAGGVRQRPRLIRRASSGRGLRRCRPDRVHT